MRRNLTPTDLYAKRPLCDSGFYETFNRPNVTLVNVKENPIRELTAAGVRTADGTVHEVDVLVCATGFDAVDGNYRRLNIRGRTGQTLGEKWQDGPTSYLGVATSGFPKVHDPGTERTLHQSAPVDRDAGRVDLRHH